MRCVGRPDVLATGRSPSARGLRVGLTLAVLGLLLGARPAAAASPTLHKLCPRQWRAGDDVATLERNWGSTQVIVVDGPSALPPGVLPSATDGEVFGMVERCLDAGSAGHRSSQVDVTLQATRDGSVVWTAPPAAFRMEVDGERATTTPDHEGYPAALINRVKVQVEGQPRVEDPVPGLLGSIVVTGVDSTGPLTRGMLPADSTLLSPEFDPDSFRGRWWVEGLSDTDVIIGYQLASVRRHPLFNEVLAKAEWLTGGEWRFRGLLVLRRDSRLPESRSVWQAETTGCVSVENQILAVRETLSRDTMVYARGAAIPAGSSVPSGAGSPVEAHPEPDVKSRCIAIRWEHGGPTGRAKSRGGGVLVEPDVVLTAAHLLLPEGERLLCARPGGGSSEVVAVTFPKPRSDWVLLRLKEPVSGPLPPLPTCDVEELASHPRAPCVIAATDAAGDLRLVKGPLYRVSPAAQAYMVEAETEPGDSGSGVFTTHGGLLGIVQAGTGSDATSGPMLTQDADLRVGAAGWTPLAQWKSAIPAAATAALLAAEQHDTDRLEDPEVAGSWERVGRDVAGASSLASRWFTQRGLVRGRRGDLAAARADFARSAALAVSEAWLRQALASELRAGSAAAWVSGNTDDALRASREEVALQPSDPQASWRLARSLRDAGDATWKTVVRGLAVESVPSHARSTIADWISVSRDPELIDLWAQAAESDPAGTGSGVALWLRAKRAADAGDLALAKRILSGADPMGPVGVRVTGLAAWLLLREKKYKEADRLCASLDLYEANSAHLATAFYVANALEDTDRAWERLRVGLARFPWDPDLLLYASMFKPPLHQSPDPRLVAIQKYSETMHR